MVRELLDPIDWERIRYIVEYGPGVGTMTREIVKRMHPDARLITIELNEDFAAYMKAEFAADERVSVIHGSAAEIDGYLEDRGWSGFDCGISGIPFSTLPEGVRDDILGKTRKHLRPGGEFVAFQFSNKVMPHLRGAFDHVEKGYVLLNLLPAHCYRCTATSQYPAASDAPPRQTTA